MKRSTLFSIGLLTAITISCSQKSTPEEEVTPASTIPSGEYFGFRGNKGPQLMLEGFISSPNPELNGTFSPDGKEFYYALSFPQLGSHLLFSKMLADGTWSSPEMAPFSGEYGGVDPLFSPDGKRLYFTSWRPTDPESKEDRHGDIWFVEKSGDVWEAPQNLGMPLNSEQSELYSSVSASGNIYFWRRSENSDIFKATKTIDGYTVVALGDQINTEFSEGDPFVSPEEDYLIFCSNRPEGLGGMDLYISFQQDGRWTKPVNLGPSINSSKSDYAPTISSDQKIFVFTSGRMEEPWEGISKDSLQNIKNKINSPENGLDNIYWMNADFIDSLKLVQK